MTRHKRSPVFAMTTDVEGHPDNGGETLISGLYVKRGAILPPWGGRERLRHLLAWYLDDRNAMVRSVFSSLAKKISSTPWEIRGRGDVGCFQELLHNANAARGGSSGWDDFIQITVLNMLIFDTGAKWLLHGAGPVDGPLYGPVTDISTLDPLRVYATGNPIYPYVYYARYNKKRGRASSKHKLHYTRVVSLVDSPIGDLRYPGWGLSALSRAITIASREVMMDRYIETSLDDKPKPGILTIGGVMDRKFEEAKAGYIRGLTADEMDIFGQTLVLFGVSGQSTPTVQHTAFSNAPEEFDFVKYTELDAKIAALAIGVDPQDVLPLSSGALGSGTQTEILAAQARGKTEGDIRAKTTRALNFDVLPRGVEFEMKYQDDKQDETRAGIAATHAQVVSAVSSSMLSSGVPMNPDDIVRYLVQVDESWRNVFTNKDGSIRSVTDADPTTEDVVVDDTGEVAEPDAKSEPETPTPVEDAFVDMFKVWRYTPALKGLALKAWVQTRTEFVVALADLMADQPTGIRGRAQLGRKIRFLLNKLGTLAFQDGLQESGVAPEEMEIEERAKIKAWLAKQSPFVSELTSQIYPNKLSRTQAAQRAELWANRSLREVYQEGLVSGKANQKYRWSLGATKDHCRTCLYLNDQVHRVKDWVRTGWVPGSPDLECGGYRCGCFFVATDEPARGRFPRG